MFYEVVLASCDQCNVLDCNNCVLYDPCGMCSIVLRDSFSLRLQVTQRLTPRFAGHDELAAGLRARRVLPHMLVMSSLVMHVEASAPAPDRGSALHHMEMQQKKKHH